MLKYLYVSQKANINRQQANINRQQAADLAENRTISGPEGPAKLVPEVLLRRLNAYVFHIIYIAV